MKKSYAKVVPVVLSIAFLSTTRLHALEDFAKSTSISSASSLWSFESLETTTKQTMYVLSDTEVMKEASTVSSTIGTVAKGSMVYILGTSGDLCEVLTPAGTTGFVSLSQLTGSPAMIFNDADEQRQVVQDTELKKLPANSTTQLVLNEGDEVRLTGTNDYEYWRVEKDGVTYYVDRNALKEVQTPVSAPIGGDFTTSFTSVWNGSPLTPGAGRINGPSGVETYYNLNMNGCVNIMRALGNTDEYWVREDGVKMLGSYVMVAADLSIRPKGSIVETSLGLGIVVDTGTFIYSNPTQIDIAVAW